MEDNGVCRRWLIPREGMRLVQLAILESEFSPEVLLRRLLDEGYEARLSTSAPERVIVVAEPPSLSRLSESVTDYVLSDWIAGYVLQLLSHEHDYLSAEDREYVGLLASHTFRMGTGASGFGLWRDKIRDVIRAVLVRSGSLNIRGILRFRAGEFLRAIDVQLTDVVQHFLADREYEEFVSMLRVMLDAQPPSTQTLHLYCTDQRVWICDEGGNLVRDREVAKAAHEASEDGEVDAEDLAMSILIMKSPCRIIIHDLAEGATWPSFAQTVERVFLERASRCEHCSTCDKLRRAASDGT